jgi:hypothetical protein
MRIGSEQKMASLIRAITKIWDAIRSCFGCSVPAPSAVDAIHEFFRYGSQYYLAGGAALCDDYSILRLRLAHPDEAKRFKEAASPPTDDLKLVYLVDLDQPDEDTRARESTPSERLKAMRESASAAAELKAKK